MRKCAWLAVWCLVGALTPVFALGATLQGTVQLQGGGDPSGIQVALDLLSSVSTPAMSGWGASLALILVTLLLARSGIRRRDTLSTAAFGMLLAATVLSGAASAAVIATTVTNSLGGWHFIGIAPATYQVTFSRSGHQQIIVAPVTVMDGNNVLAGVTMVPCDTPAPQDTSTPYPTYTPLPTYTVPPSSSPTATPTSTPSSATATPTPMAAGSLYASDAIAGNLRVVPSGMFVQGSFGGEPCRDSQEVAFAHAIARNLVMMETEVTQGMWAALQAAQPSLPVDRSNTFVGAGASQPAQNMTWQMTLLFANLLSQERGYTSAYYKDAGFTDTLDASDFNSGNWYCRFDVDGFRLPTEGEWEYACRATAGGVFNVAVGDFNAANCSAFSCNPSKFAALRQVAVLCPSSGTSNTGTRPGNQWNLRDMHGNVAEWCWDFHAGYPASGVNYAGPSSGLYQVVRGGNFFDYVSFARSAARSFRGHQFGAASVGFRLVRTVP